MQQSIKVVVSIFGREIVFIQENELCTHTSQSERNTSAYAVCSTSDKEILFISEGDQQWIIVIARAEGLRQSNLSGRWRVDLFDFTGAALNLWYI